MNPEKTKLPQDVLKYAIAMELAKQGGPLDKHFLAKDPEIFKLAQEIREKMANPNQPGLPLDKPPGGGYFK